MTLLFGIHVFVVLSMIGIILIQKTEGGLGLGGGSNSPGMFTVRGTANFLTKATAILAFIFFANCLLMSRITTNSQEAPILQKQ